MPKKNKKAAQPVKVARFVAEDTTPGDTLPYPWPAEGKGFTPDQVVATGEHIIAISGWVPIDQVRFLVDELIEMADDEFGEFEDERGHTRCIGNEKEAARYALLAARLMAAHDLVATLHPQVADRS